MKRTTAELTNEQLDSLLQLYVSLTSDGRTTQESAALRRERVDAEVAKLRASLGLSAQDASEIAVILESNRRSHWRGYGTVGACPS
jgi:hypothetical protein